MQSTVCDWYVPEQLHFRFKTSFSTLVCLVPEVKNLFGLVLFHLTAFFPLNKRVTEVHG